MNLAGMMDAAEIRQAEKDAAKWEAEETNKSWMQKVQQFASWRWRGGLARPRRNPL